jgi:hypothetical protein
MTRARRDPLLATVRAVLSVAMIGAVLVSSALLATIPLALLGRATVLAELSRRAGRALPADFIYPICGVMALIAVTAVLGLLFIRLLRRIIDSVADGDPFIPENAVRLSQMGWLSVAVQLIAIPAGALSGWIAYTGHLRYIDVGFSIGGVVLALILFILARVFRQGAQMRADLEGTV